MFKLTRQSGGTTVCTIMHMVTMKNSQKSYKFSVEN